MEAVKHEPHQLLNSPITFTVLLATSPLPSEKCDLQVHHNLIVAVCDFHVAQQRMKSWSLLTLLTPVTRKHEAETKI